MATLPKPEPERPRDGAAQADRDAAGVLTPPPSSNSARFGDEPTVVDAAQPQKASGVPTALDIGGSYQATSQNYNSDAATLVPGTVLGRRYEVVAMLGEGGMGAVYKALDRELNRAVALKVIRPELARNKAISDRFKQELLLAREVTHRNVVRIFDIGEAEGIKFITMEYVDGEDLRALLLREKKLGAEEAVEIIRQVCCALEAAHSVGIIHRDLKPQNIMRDHAGRIVVMDFGLARTVGSDGMTRTGALVGTMDYMSPEQGLGQSLDERSDIYTVGLIFYEMLTGSMPFVAESALASLIKRTQERVVPVSNQDNTIARSVSNIVSKCLERETALRYQSATELLADLEGWQGKRAGATLSFHSRVGPWGQTLPWPMIAAIGTVILLATVAWILRDRLLASAAKQQAAAVTQESLAVLPFHNASGDPTLDWLGSSLAEMLGTAIGHSSRLHSVAQDRVQQVYSDLRLGPNASMDADNLGRIAEFSNASMLVWGQYVKFSGQIRISATLQDRKHDRTVPIQLASANEENLPGLVDQLATSIRNNLSVSSDVIKDLKASSFQPRSHSAAALHAYNDALRWLRGGQNLEAAASLQSAIKADPEFALAYSRLAETDSALGYDAEAEQASRKAVALGQQSDTANKYLIDAAHARVLKDNKKAIELYEALSKSMPEDSDIEYALGSLYTETGAYDKARSRLAKLLQADSKNTRLLWQMGVVEMMNDNPQAALEPLNKALSRAIETDNQELKALILQAMGISYRVMHKPQDAMREYEEAMLINRRLGLKRNLAGNFIEMAIVETAAGKPEPALVKYKTALQLQREIGMKKEVGDTLIDMGTVYESRGDYDHALQNYKESLQIQRDSGDENYQALCLSNIGGAYLAKEDFDNALTYLEQALQIREKLNVASDTADTLALIGQVYATTGKYDDALRASMRSLELYRKAGNSRGVAEQSHQIGLIFEYQGRIGSAVSAMKDAVNRYRTLADRSADMAEALKDLAEIQAQAGNGSDSGVVLQEAQSLARDLHNERLQAEILDTAGDVKLYAGEWEAANRSYTQALRTAAQSGAHDVVLAAKLHLAEILLGRGDSHSSLRAFRTVAQQANRSNLKHLSLLSSLDMAEALISNKNYANAVQALEADLTSSENLGARYQTARIHCLLGNALRQSGKGADAALHYRQALAIMDDIQKEPGAEKLLGRIDARKIYDSARQGPRLLPN